MSATDAPSPVIIRRPPDIAGSAERMQEIVDGLVQAGCSPPDLVEQYEHLTEDELIAFDSRVTEAAAREIAPEVARMLEAAIARRLPWEWPQG